MSCIQCRIGGISVCRTGGSHVCRTGGSHVCRIGGCHVCRTGIPVFRTVCKTYSLVCRTVLRTGGSLVCRTDSPVCRADTLYVELVLVLYEDMVVLNLGLVVVYM